MVFELHICRWHFQQIVQMQEAHRSSATQGADSLDTKWGHPKQRSRKPHILCPCRPESCFFWAPAKREPRNLRPCGANPGCLDPCGANTSDFAPHAVQNH